MTGIGISVRDIGPIVEFEHTLDGYGLHVLKGKHGSGKSITLRTIELATTGRTDVRPVKSDGVKSGEATVAGKTLRISRQIREDGELTVDGVGDLSLAGLHSPGFDKPETRDRHRIKALARLAGVEADASLFHEVGGGKAHFEAVIEADTLKTDDLVEMAGRIKRVFEKRAQVKEEEERVALARAQAAAEQCAGIDLATPHDQTELQARLTMAIQERTRVTTQRKDGLERIAQADRSRAAILSSQTAQSVTIEQATAYLSDAEVHRDRCQKLHDQLAYDLRIAAENLKDARTEVDRCRERQTSVEQHAKTIEAWQADIDAGARIVCPTEIDVEQAAIAVQNAEAAVTLGIQVRNAITAKANADAYTQTAKDAGTFAQRLRNAARDTPDVLSDAIGRIANCPLKVRNDEDGNPRLVLKTDRSDAEYFDELSDGERWPILIALAAGENRLIVLPQAAFGELSDSTRDMIDRLARELECFILTAQVDDSVLRCEAWAAPELATA